MNHYAASLLAGFLLSSAAQAVIVGGNITTDSYTSDGKTYSETVPAFDLLGTNCTKTTLLDSATSNRISTVIKATTGTDVAVTWQFSAPVKCGTFANGDLWITPVSGTSVTLASITTNHTAVAVEVDPSSDTAQGLLDASNKYGTYSAAKNIAASLPSVISSTSTRSLVAAVRRNETLDGPCGTSAIIGGCLAATQVITVLPTAPAGNGKNLLRPTIVGTSKLSLSLDDFDLTRIPSNSGFAATTTQLRAVSNRWNHTIEIMERAGSEGGRAFRSANLIDDYGSGAYQRWNDDLALLMSDDLTTAQKKKALASMLTYGADCYAGFMKSGAPFTIPSGAGQSTGVTMPCYLFAALAVDPAYSTRTATFSASPDALSVPQEIKQVQIRANGTAPVWGDLVDQAGPNLTEQTRWYWAGVFSKQCFDGAAGTCELSGGGKKTLRDPYGYVDGPETQPGTSYMGVTLGVYEGFAAAQYLIPELKAAFNYQPFLTYVDRVLVDGVMTLPDPCAPPDAREPLTCDVYTDPDTCSYYSLSANVIEATWGPNVGDQTQCIANNSGSNTGQAGRFATKDGGTITKSYSSSQWSANYATLKAGAQ